MIDTSWVQCARKPLPAQVTCSVHPTHQVPLDDPYSHGYPEWQAFYHFCHLKASLRGVTMSPALLLDLTGTLEDKTGFSLKGQTAKWPSQEGAGTAKEHDSSKLDTRGCKDAERPLGVSSPLCKPTSPPASSAPPAAGFSLVSCHAQNVPWAPAGLGAPQSCQVFF